MTVHAARRRRPHRRSWRPRRRRARLSLVLGIAAALAAGIFGAPAFENAPRLETAIAKLRTAMASAVDSSDRSPRDDAAYDGDRIVIVDGDTVALPCAIPSPGCAEKLRLLSIDTPETWRPNCEAERIAGLRAKQRLAELLRGAAVTVERDGRDRYGRTLATVRTAAGDVGSILVAEGLALPYRPGSAAKAERIRHWCE